jgi:hypothetical protein
MFSAKLHGQAIEEYLKRSTLERPDHVGVLYYMEKNIQGEWAKMFDHTVAFKLQLEYCPSRFWSWLRRYKKKPSGCEVFYSNVVQFQDAIVSDQELNLLSRYTDHAISMSDI